MYCLVNGGAMNLTLRGLWSFLLSASVALTVVVVTSSSAMAQQPGDEQPGDEQPDDTQPESEQPDDAQPAGEQSDDADLMPPPPPVPGAPSDGSDQDGEPRGSQTQQGDPAGWNLLSRAAEQLALGRKRSARRLLEQLVVEYPNHPATAVSADALDVLTGEHDKSVELGAEEETSGLARAELAFFQTAHGIVLGTELCFMLDCEDPRAAVLALGAGGGLGLAISLMSTSDGITPGHALLLNSGTTWGFANGLLASYALEINDTNAAGLYAATQLGGLGLGALIWDVAEPTAGEVSMANSGGLWVGFLTFMAHVASEFEADDEAIAWSVLLGADLGIVGGALLSQRYPMSRGRTFVIDSGGILGFFIGIGTYVLADSDVESPTGLSMMGMLGTVTGLGTATYLTRNWDKPEGEFSANWTVAPTDGGAMLSVGGSF
jgi:hypothetical protein